MENKERVKYLKHRKVIGIDPGKNGGIAVFSVDIGKVVEVIKMPETPQELLQFLRLYSINAVCYLEKVGGMPGQGGSAMFNFGKGFGQLEMALIALKIPTTEVSPQRWQKTIHVGNQRDKTKTEWKNKLKARAEQLFPYVGKITLAKSDALLIMQYGVEQEK